MLNKVFELKEKLENCGNGEKNHREESTIFARNFERNMEIYDDLLRHKIREKKNGRGGEKINLHIFLIDDWFASITLFRAIDFNQFQLEIGVKAIVHWGDGRKEGSQNQWMETQ